MQNEATNGEALHLNRAELARTMLVSLPTIDRWITEGCPLVQRGGSGRPYIFDLADVRRWRGEVIARAEREKAEREAAIAASQAELDVLRVDPDGVDGLPFRAQRDFYEAQRARMIVAQRRGELAETTQFARILDGLMVFLNDRLQTVPDILERECNLPPEVVAVLQQKIDEIQAGLARELENGAVDLDSEAA